MKRLGALLVACTVCVALARADQTFRSGIALVTMNVAVRQSGSPVRGLQAADFEVTDNGIAQEIAVHALRARHQSQP